ncbi:aldehyde reductase [Ensifer adhaerens]|uniref:SDR family oxidoreductase n=1 Tax=Ensifer adhaerens TaxID=106592 RepID=UPI0023A984E3|nr:aldehyde reductase [Ensifer adhaerens]WDZ78060.1 aldehyde reductase [Ensifer adhaerens]
MNVRTEATVAVTGIGGFVGRHVALFLLRQGYDVRGTVRDLARAEEIERSIRAAGGTEGAKLSFAEADLLAEPGWVDAFTGVSCVMHTASPFPARLPANEVELIDPARDGTLRVLTAARASGVRRVVLTSSVAAVIYGAGRAPYTEDDWTDPQSPLVTPYYRSKIFAERAAWDYAADNGPDLVVVNPGMVLGPLLGREIGTSVAVVRNLLRGGYPALPKFSVPIADVRDVADAHLRAMTVADAVGERFLIAGETLSLADIASVLRRKFPAHAAKLPKFILPNWLAGLAAPFDTGLRLIVRELGHDARISNEKARRVLGWQPRTAEEAVTTSVESLIGAGLV